MTLTDFVTRRPITCMAETSITGVARLMLENDVGSVVVVDELDRPVGMVTDRDLVLRAVARPVDGDQPVECVMTHDPAGVSANDSVLDAARQMALRSCRRLPVVDPDSGKLLGVVSLDDVLLQAGESLDHVLRLLNNEQHDRSSLLELLSRRQVA